MVRGRAKAGAPDRSTAAPAPLRAAQSLSGHGRDHGRGDRHAHTRHARDRTAPRARVMRAPRPRSMSSSTWSRRMRSLSPITCMSVWRLPMCQASRAKSCADAAVISSSGSGLPATRTMAPSSSTRPSPSRSAAACGRSSRNAMPPSPVKVTRRRWRSSASSTTRSMALAASQVPAVFTADARRIGLDPFRTGNSAAPSAAPRRARR